MVCKNSHYWILPSLLMSKSEKRRLMSSSVISSLRFRMAVVNSTKSRSPELSTSIRLNSLRKKE
jgi:hypothetical protein